MAFDIGDLTMAERETHLLLVADNRNIWHVYSDDPVMQRRIEKIGAKLVREDASGSKHYELTFKQVGFRREMVLSEEEKTRRKNRIMRAVNDKRKNEED